MIKFNKYNIIDAETGLKVKVYYSEGLGADGLHRVWISEDGYGRDLFKIFKNAFNDSDSMTDYFDHTRVTFFEGDEYYNDVMQVIYKISEMRKKRYEQKMLKLKLKKISA